MFFTRRAINRKAKFGVHFNRSMEVFSNWILWESWCKNAKSWQVC